MPVDICALMLLGNPVPVCIVPISGSAAEQGLLAIPSIVGQLAQIFLGAAMAPTIAKRADAYYAALKQQADIEEQQKGASQDLQDAAPASTSSTSDAGAAVAKIPDLHKFALEQQAVTLTQTPHV
jgi:solute carrier family 10 (sodium/bile acid cotransporter), member 7